MSRAGTAISVVAFVGVAAAAAYWGPGLINGNGNDTPTDTCTVSHGDTSYWLTAEQANNAAIIAAMGERKGFETAGVTVALATAIQESSLRNLDYGDRDSLGLFQQRPSQGWGEAESVTDPYYASDAFYSALARVDGWKDMAVTDAAQAVQRSGFPLAYADHEDEARAWALAFTGHGGLVTCSVTGPETSSPQQFAKRVADDFDVDGPAVDVIDVADGVTVLGVRPSEDSPQARAALAAWAIATASVTGVVWVDADETLVKTDGSVASVEHVPERADYPGIQVGIETR